MKDTFCRSVERLGCCLAAPFVAFAGGLRVLCETPPGPGEGGLTELDQDRIRQSLWRIRRDFESLGGEKFIGEIGSVLKNAFGNREELVRSVGAWAVLVDTLVMEAEREYGSAPGRGAMKKRQVKAALLYWVHCLKVDLPRVPAFVEPIVWDVLLDGAIDVVAQFSNRNRRWGEVPTGPSLRARVNLAAQHVSLWGQGLLGLFTRVAWWLVLRSSPVSPALRSAVDKFVAANPDPLRSFVVLAAWAGGHTKELVALTDLLSTALLEAQFAAVADPQRRLAYAREVVLAFLEESGSLPERGSFAYGLVEGLVGFGIELVARLFEHRSPGLLGSGPSAAAKA